MAYPSSTAPASGGFLFGGRTGLTYDELQDRRKRQDALASRIMGQKPKTVLEGWAALLQGAAIGIDRYRTNKGMREGTEQSTSGFQDYLKNRILGQQPSTAGGSAANLPMPGAANEMAATAPGGGGNNYRNAIASIESAGSGDYSAVGPTNPKMGRALGRYQIMEANIGPWSREALGREVSADEFMSNPQLQDAIFDHRFGSYVKQYGPEGAAQAWFAGPGGVGKTNRKDVLGTDVGTYGRKFMNALGPTNEVASLDPSAGMPPAMAAIERQASASGYVDPQVSAPNALRPFRPGERRENADGSYSTEISTTWQLPDGSWANVPSLWMGPNGPQQFNPDDEQGILGAMQRYEQQTGQKFPRFRSEAEAEQAAVARSAAGGAGAPQQGQNPLPVLPSRNIAPPPAVASPPQQMPQQAPRQVAQAQPMGGVDQRLLQYAYDPFLPPEMRAQAQMLLEQQMQQADPRYQLEMQKLRQDLNAPRKRDTSVVNGRLVDNQTGQVIAEYPDAMKPTADQQNYEYYRDLELQNGREPLGPLEWEQAQRKAGATTVNNNMGESDKFYEKLDQKNAEMFATLSDGGMQARGKMGQIDRLEGLFANVPQGIEGGLKKIAGDYGIPIGKGTSDIQAASALLERMVPEQRAPGTGPMSDADIKMFRGSLPSIINQPGGNQLIFQTLRGIAEYEMQMGEISDLVADRSITPAEGRKRIRELKNPLANYKVPEGTTPNRGFQTKSGVKWSIR
jgi:hypothetical protein